MFPSTQTTGVHNESKIKTSRRGGWTPKPHIAPASLLNGDRKPASGFKPKVHISKSNTFGNLSPIKEQK